MNFFSSNLNYKIFVFSSAKQFFVIWTDSRVVWLVASHCLVEDTVALCHAMSGRVCVMDKFARSLVLLRGLVAGMHVGRRVMKALVLIAPARKW